MGNFTIESAFPYLGMEPDGGRLNVTGNSAGEDKIWLHKCWSGEDRALRVDSGKPDGSGNGSASLLHSKRSCFGYPMTFTMGAFSPTGPLSWQVPFTFLLTSRI